MIALLPDMPAAVAGQGLTPKGPTGLLRALIAAASSGSVVQGLPTVNAADVGAGASLFDYDATLALDLDGNAFDGDPLGA